MKIQWTLLIPIDFMACPRIYCISYDFLASYGIVKNLWNWFTAMNPHRIPWNGMVFYENLWNSMTIHGIPWNYMTIHGTPWTNYHGNLWNSMEFYGNPWNAMEFIGFYEILWNLWNLWNAEALFNWEPGRSRGGAGASRGSQLTSRGSREVGGNSRYPPH